MTSVFESFSRFSHLSCFNRTDGKRHEKRDEKLAEVKTTKFKDSVTMAAQNKTPAPGEEVEMATRLGGEPAALDPAPAVVEQSNGKKKVSPESPHPNFN